MAKPKLTDVAKHAGVSVTTVSRVLNNRGYLSKKTKDAVNSAIAEIGYRPNEVARSLLGQRTFLIGLIVPSVANPFFGELAAAIEGALAGSGYKMMLCNSQGQATQERAYLDLLLANQVDGIITSAHNDAIAGYANAHLPIVAVDRHLGSHIPNIHADNALGARLATERLLSHGCNQIALITATDSPHNERANGYRAVMDAAGKQPLIMEYGFDTPKDELQQKLFAWLDSQPNLDGVFTTDDPTALLVLEWAKQRGRAIPSEFRVIGYDGTPFVLHAMPGLTTVVQPIDQIATRAVTVLLDRINAADSGAKSTDAGTASLESDAAPADTVLPVRLHLGWSA